MLYFFTAAPKNERVAALQAHHVFALIGGHHHEFFDESLRCGFAAAALAHVHDAGTWGRVGGDDLVVDQVVDQQDRGGLYCFDCLDGQQLRVTRAGADQGAFARIDDAANTMAHGSAFTIAHPAALASQMAWWERRDVRDGRVFFGFHSCPDRRKMCSTCRAIDGGTGLVPAMT